MNAGRRLWRTAEGRLVGDGHADASVLAYGEGDQLSPADEALLAADEADEAETKARPQVPNKARRPGANKGG